MNFHIIYAICKFIHFIRSPHPVSPSNINKNPVLKGLGHSPTNSVYQFGKRKLITNCAA